MKLLAIDAATEACSVAVKTDTQTFEYFEICPQQHSQKLLPAVSELLAEANMSLTDLDGIIYGCGPGSFTGVRIGVSVTQGLAFGADLKVWGVSNLAMMAQQAIVELEAKYVVSAIDARMSEIYFSIYENVNGRAEPIIKDVVCKPDDVGQMIKTFNIDINNEYVAVGTGWQTYKDELMNVIPATLTSINLPNAAFSIALASEKFSSGEALDAELAQPNYVRDEVTWKKLPGR